MRPEHWNPVRNTSQPLVLLDGDVIHALVAPWQSCILNGQEGPNVCTPPPRDGANYEYAHTGEGTAILPFGLNHAPLNASVERARDHYAHTGDAAAIVTYYEDEDGIWLHGTLLPLTPRERAIISTAAISGDWRWIEEEKRLRMIASQVVNSPGFRPSLSNTRFAMAASANSQSMTMNPVFDVDHDLVYLIAYCKTFQRLSQHRGESVV